MPLSARPRPQSFRPARPTSTHGMDGSPSDPARRRALGSVSTIALARRWREQHDQAARQELCERFLPLARQLAGRYRNSHDPFEDLMQVAMVGLLGAIERFDPDRGANFSSFAVPTILGELKRYFRNTAWAVHVPRGGQEMALRVDRASREITARTGRLPQVRDLAEYLEVPVEHVLRGLDAGSAQYSASLDAPAGGADDEEPRSLADSLGAEDDGFGLIETKLSLASAIARLPYLERRALTLRGEHEMKQIEIAHELGCSQMQVSRLLHRAATTLRVLTDPDVTSREAQV
jgi:RNA polymerase sigma-B factor